MRYTEKDGKIILSGLDSFDISQILECGQCFRFEKLGEKEYKIIAMGRALYIKQNADMAELYPCSLSDYENIWRNYFDMDTDYEAIKNKVSVNDDIMQKAVEYGGGIRLLNQEPYECLISFIISQNNNIPRIKGIISRMSVKYGTEADGEFMFPTLEQLADVSEEELFSLRMGFRARYIRDCLDRLISGSVSLERAKKLPTDELLSMLFYQKQGGGVRLIY